MFKRLISVIAGLITLIAPVAASAQSAAQLRSSFDQLLAYESESWIFKHYEPGSVGDPIVAAASPDGRAIVYAAGFRYGLGAEDVVSVTIIDGRRTCLGYRSNSTACGLYSRSGNGISGSDVAKGAGAIVILCAIFCPSGSSGNNGGGGQQQPDTRNCTPAYTTGPDGQPQWYYPCGDR
jgi:hypothetical protein